MGRRLLKDSIVSIGFEHEITRLRLKLGGVILGIVILIWLPIEESNKIFVLILSGLVCAWAGIWLIQGNHITKLRTIIKYILVGGGAGLMMGLVAILLMAIKTGIHGHGTPDYTPEQIIEILLRTPFFVLGGVLIGVGGSLLRIVQWDTIQGVE